MKIQLHKHIKDITIECTAFYEKSLGLTPAYLLIIEIKNRTDSLKQKRTQLSEKNSRKYNKSIFYDARYDFFISI